MSATNKTYPEAPLDVLEEDGPHLLVPEDKLVLRLMLHQSVVTDVNGRLAVHLNQGFALERKPKLTISAAMFQLFPWQEKS